MNILLLLLLLLLLAPPATRAEIPEPDNVLYGAIYFGTNQITAADTDIVIEARRTPTGPTLSTYRMGDLPGAANFYSLRLPLESISPIRDPAASEAGQLLYIVVADATGLRAQQTVALGPRGQLIRLDFGDADSDGNGLPDAWERLYFTGTGVNPNADPDGDGASNAKEQIAGTDPTSSESVFKLTVQHLPTGVEVSFPALRASGPGYEGKNRYYTLEATTNLVLNLWIAPVSYSNLLGDNQVVRYLVIGQDSATFFRAKVSLPNP